MTKRTTKRATKRRGGGSLVGHDLINATPLAAVAHPLTEASGREVVAVIVKATFDVRRGAVVPAEPRPIRADDVLYDDESPWSSVRYPSDLCPQKAGADVVVVGSAIAPRPVAEMEVAVKMRDVTAPLRVHGPRVYYTRLGQVAIGPAAPTESVPIVYEKAYGGVTAEPLLIEERNPSGVGFARSPADLDGKAAPQIEHPGRPIKGGGDRPNPAGYGAIATWWSPRRERAGTFDDRWRADRFPLMPLDFDVRYYNVASPGLMLEEPLRPGDAVAVMGMSVERLFRFDVPPLGVVFCARFDTGRAARLPAAIDTLLIEPGEQRIEIVARQVFPIGRGREVLRELRVDVDDG